MWNVLKRWKEQKRKLLLKELEFVQKQMTLILSENAQLCNIATKCARESATAFDETRGSRMEGRSSTIRENFQLLAKLHIEETRLKQKLGMSLHP